MGKGKIVVAGHICLDITPVFSSDKVQPLSKVLIPGKLVQMKDVNISTGGAVANTGLALKVLGADVELMGKVGDDEFGRIVLERLGRYGAAEGMILSKDSFQDLVEQFSVFRLHHIRFQSPSFVDQR